MCSVIGYCGEVIDRPAFEKGFAETKSRGPDDSRIIDVKDGVLGFHRLSIMGLHDEGMQPFSLNGCYTVCNGELYGFKAERDRLKEKGYTFKSD
ncbi:MAG: asparagine synthetase B, partial [Clostridia bacterium]|nr:asparagine synthetase B [Clostridia bacterium]